ncbi:hypothetical protein [Pikeienuella sp. HZG-20]|uniref:hypothetical protein n=1 Tax=Paludibacillus litoralis TaxID=3133267 RepID=UPI0030EC051E
MSEQDKRAGIPASTVISLIGLVVLGFGPMLLFGERITRVEEQVSAANETLAEIKLAVRGLRTQDMADRDWAIQRELNTQIQSQIDGVQERVRRLEIGSGK